MSFRAISLTLFFGLLCIGMIAGCAPSTEGTAPSGGGAISAPPVDVDDTAGSASTTVPDGEVPSFDEPSESVTAPADEAAPEADAPAESAPETE